MPRFSADGFREVTADSAREAARVFATRLARKKYGRAGYCRTLRLDSWTEDSKNHTFQAFIGRAVRGEPGATTGNDEWIFVHRLPA